MKITLVTASFNDLVHGTFNDKKTGCGINLMKPETASRYHRGGEMSFLGELTCEKCKAKIAKEMIKADSKEMKAWLKEEKLREKRGEDDGLVELASLEVKPTSVAPPEPVRPPEPPVVPANNVQVNTNNPAYSDDLAQFAVNKPQPAPEPPEEDNFLAQFAINKPQETPEPAEEESEDDFLAQFAVKKPQEEEPVDDFLTQFAVKKPEDIPDTVAEEPVDDFLAQFSMSSPAPEKSYEEETPSAPPVIDDISDALSALRNNPAVSLHKDSETVKQETEDDILSIFSVSNSANDVNNTSSNIMDEDEDESIFDSMNSDNTDSGASEWDIIANQLFGESIPDAELQSPVIEDIAVPEIEDITVPEIEDIKAPILDDIALPEIDIPEIEDIATPQPDTIEIPEPQQTSAPVKPAVPPVQPAPQATVPPVQPAPQAVIPPVQPAPQATIPPVQPAPQATVPPVQPVIPPVAPQNMPNIQPVTAPASVGIGQIVTVPQITGYDQNGQPVYAYMQMIMQGYDQNGQPVMMPMPQNMMGMGMPMPVQMPVQPAQPEYSSLNKNSRLQAVLDSLDEPVSEKDMTIGQKIAAAEAAKGSPVSANVSKIATNQHIKSTSQAFINAISESKDDTQSLTESQGLKPKTMVLDSIEDVLSQLGDDSLKKKKETEAKIQQNVPKYDEFKTPNRTPSSSFSRPVPSSSRTSAPNMSDMPLTKSQLKELKKQQKIDAKFQKEMAKRNK